MSRNRRTGSGRSPSELTGSVESNLSSTKSGIESSLIQTSEGGVSFSAQPTIGIDQHFSLRVWINDHQVIIAWIVSVIAFAFWFGVAYTNISRDIVDLKSDVSRIDDDSRKMAEKQADLMIRVTVAEIKLGDSLSKDESDSGTDKEDDALPNRDSEK